MRGRATSAISVGITAALLIIATPAKASCAQPLPFPDAIDAAPAVFVGTVVDTDDSERRAVVEVDDVWKGEEVPDSVDLWGTPAKPGGGFTTVDRIYEDGERYLFVPFAKEGDLFRDNACTRTTVFRPALERFRPAAEGEATRSPIDDDESEPRDRRESVRAAVSDFQWFMTGFFTATLLALVLYAIKRGRKLPR